MIANAEIKMPAATSAASGRVSERSLIILLFAGSWLYLLAFRNVVNMEPDEGIVLQGAQRILDGQIPYRDFFTFYTPGSFYLTALLFRIFGDSLGIARTALTLVAASFPIFTYVLARRTRSRQIALLVAILVATSGTPYRFLVLHNWDSTFWACMAVYSATRWLESSLRGWACAAGTFASFTFLSEQSKGAGLYLGLAIALFIFAVTRNKIRSGTPAFVSGILWPLILTFAYFGSQHAIRPMIAAWLWPLHHYSVANRVGYGHQNWSDEARNLLFYTGSVEIRTVKILAISPGFIVPVLPLIAIGLLVYWSNQLLRKRDSRSAHYVLLSAILSGLFVSVVAVRADIIHFMYLAPLFFLVIAWILDAQDLPGKLLMVLRPYLCAFFAIAFALMGIALIATAAGARNRLETRRGTIRTNKEDSVVEFVQAHTVPGEKILVYPYLPLYYYLTGTMSSSRYEYFQPGMNTPEQAQEIIESLQTVNVRTVLFEPSFPGKIPSSWPGTPLSAVANDEVAGYLARNYRVCKALPSAAGWNFLYMSRKDSPCP